jgi:hypothetical protein
MMMADNTVAVAPEHGLVAAGLLIPSAREPGMLTNFGPFQPEVVKAAAPRTPDAVTIAQPRRHEKGHRVDGFGAGTSFMRNAAGKLEDVVLLLLAVFLFPLAIVLIGAPLALGVRLVLEIARRLF